MALKIKLVKSLAGRHDKHIATAYSLGLHKIGDETTQPNNEATQGKVKGSDRGSISSAFVSPDRDSRRTGGIRFCK